MNGETRLVVIKLLEEDRKELVKLYEEAERMPMIGFSVKQMIEGRDWASQAWDHVRKKMDELGEKYGFDPKRIRGISKKTGEVFI